VGGSRPDFHFYTLNLELSVRNILEGLQFVPPREKVKPLPWRPVCASAARVWPARVCPITHTHGS
jgi:hypothetical protein